MPRLSVVVPVYDVEDYLQECLDSLAAQTLGDLEVIMVDDGSPDGSPAIAAAMARRDDRFRLVRQANAGLGPARNEGVRHARGEFLAFADSDDVVMPTAYERMVSSLERTGSDLATGNVYRLEEGTTFQSPLHKHLRRGTLQTHVTRRPRLVRDCTAWNKVFRRAFWDRHGFLFPPGFYEDAPVTLRAHVLAASVDVLADTVYYWRKRAGSISENRAQAANVIERMASARVVRDGLAELAPALVDAYDEHFLLDISLPCLFNALRTATDAELAELTELGRSFLCQVDPRLVARLRAFSRLRCHLIAEGLSDQLAEVVEYQRRGLVESSPIVRRRGWLGRPRLFARYPYFGQGVPKEVYDVTAEVNPVARVERACWNGGRLRIEGHAYLPRLEVAGGVRLRVWFQAAGRLGKLGKLARRGGVRGVGLVELPVDYDGSHFVVEADPTAFRWATEWRLCAEFAAAGFRRARTVANVPEAEPVSARAGVQPVIAGPRFLVRVPAVG
jgi:CDP-glycerol glycerophosphotransferase